MRGGLTKQYETRSFVAFSMATGTSNSTMITFFPPKNNVVIWTHVSVPTESILLLLPMLSEV